MEAPQRVTVFGLDKLGSRSAATLELARHGLGVTPTSPRQAALAKIVGERDIRD